MTETQQERIVIIQNEEPKVYFLHSLKALISSRSQDDKARYGADDFTRLDYQESIMALDRCDKQGKFNLEGFVGGPRDVPQLLLENIRKKLSKANRVMNPLAKVDFVEYRQQNGLCLCLYFSDYLNLNKPQQIRVETRHKISTNR